ncbi:MAG TPA: hypothetical protein VG777_01415 [Thermoanaerobaculia bacterium]|nr:hypothetical protein [Thermoanaerobaculia bacterium]
MKTFRKTLRKFIVGLLFLTLAPVLRADSDELRFLPSLQAALEPFPDQGSQSPPSETPPPPPETPPPAPSQPSLQDLGFTPEQQVGSVEAQARLDKRTRMLKIHQRLGLITIIPFVATLATAGGASEGEGRNRSQRNLHAALGVVTAAMYIATASYAIRAPKIEGTRTRGQIRWHKALAWVHGVGMVLTPILGAMARNQLNNGERVHGIAKAHSAVAAITVAAYAAAIGTVAIKF